MADWKDGMLANWKGRVWFMDLEIDEFLKGIKDIGYQIVDYAGDAMIIFRAHPYNHLSLKDNELEVKYGIENHNRTSNKSAISRS